MKTLVACGQFDPVPADHAANTSVMRELAGGAASKGAALIVFPELCLTGYLPPREMKSLATSVDGPEVSAVRSLAGRAGIAVCFGWPERAPDGRLFDSLACVDASGVVISIYRKVHLWDSEREWAAAGDGFSVFNAGPFRCGMWICYDTRFPEAARATALAGATAAVVGTAWVGPGEEWELALRARALDNGMFVAGAALQTTRSGSASPYTFHGASLLVDPHGRVLARAGEGRQDLVLGEYDPEEIRAFRARLPLLRHRRPAAYGPADKAADWP